MTVTIDLSPELETQLVEIAARTGQDPASFARTAVEEKLQRAAQANGDQQPQTLEQALAGLTGIVHSTEGHGGGRLSEMNGGDFADDLVHKQHRGEL
jgi:predicted transcriptional regulator